MESVVAGILGAVLGALASGYFALRAARWQVDAVMLQVRGTVNERLYETNRTLLEYLGEKPTLRPFFYDNKPLTECINEAEKNQVLLVAEMYAGLMELTALYLPDLPDTLREQWRGFVTDIYSRSPAVRHYFVEFGAWHAQVLMDMLPKPCADGRAGIASSAEPNAAADGGA